jgi:hypothetical protein
MLLFYFILFCTCVNGFLLHKTLLKYKTVYCFEEDKSIINYHYGFYNLKPYSLYTIICDITDNNCIELKNDLIENNLTVILIDYKKINPIQLHNIGFYGKPMIYKDEEYVGSIEDIYIILGLRIL